MSDKDAYSPPENKEKKIYVNTRKATTIEGSLRLGCGALSGLLIGAYVAFGPIFYPKRAQPRISMECSIFIMLFIVLICAILARVLGNKFYGE